VGNFCFETFFEIGQHSKCVDRVLSIGLARSLIDLNLIDLTSLKTFTKKSAQSQVKISFETFSYEYLDWNFLFKNLTRRNFYITLEIPYFINVFIKLKNTKNILIKTADEPIKHLRSFILGK